MVTDCKDCYGSGEVLDSYHDKTGKGDICPTCKGTGKIMMTIEEFNKIPAGKPFADGVLPNSPEGLFMTNTGGKLRWVAKKDQADDWCIYCHWDFHNRIWILQHGDKIHNEKHIRLCVPCDDEMFSKYRF